MGDRLFSSVVVVDQPVLIIWTISEPQLSLFNLIKDLVWFSHNSVCSGLWKEEQSELRSKGWACLIFSWDHLCNGSAVCDRFSRALAKHRRLLAEGFKLNCSLRKGRKDKEGWELIITWWSWTNGSSCSFTFIDRFDRPAPTMVLLID